MYHAYQKYASCLDIDECTTDAASCGEYTNCTDTSGSFECVCQIGFTGNAYVNCTGLYEMGFVLLFTFHAWVRMILSDSITTHMKPFLCCTL